MVDSFYNLAFERSVLNSIIFEPSLLTSITLAPESFFLETHKNIFKSIQHLYSTDKPIDEEFIRIDLEKRKLFDERVLVEILTANPISDLSPYVLELKKMAKKREILSAVNQIKSLSTEIDGDELLSQFESAADKLRNDESLDVFSITSIHEIEAEEPEFICKDWIPIPKKTVTLFSAGGGTGKTMAALQLALRYVEENAFQKKVFMWLSEDPAGLSKNRAIDIATNVLGKNFTSFDGLIDISDNSTFPVMIFKSSGEGVIRPEFYQMKSKLKEYELIIIDPLIGFFAGDENSNSHARQFMQLFTQWATKEKKTIVFIHHSSKGIRIGSESKTRGASAFVDAVRAVYEFEKIKPNKADDEIPVNESLRRVILTKDNYNATRYFGFQKDLMLFPEKNNLFPVHVHTVDQKSKQKIKTRTLPPRPKSIYPPGANIRIVDEPADLPLTEEQKIEIDQKLKSATAIGIKFDD
ncbi:MAG: AAA family ATPase [Sulfuricurvum sp.]